jgi:hypothetical protein
LDSNRRVIIDGVELELGSPENFKARETMKLFTVSQGNFMMFSLCEVFSNRLQRKERKAYCSVDKPRRLLESITREYRRKGPECSGEEHIEYTNDGWKNEVANCEKDRINHWIRYDAYDPNWPMKHLQSPPWVELLKS